VQGLEVGYADNLLERFCVELLREIQVTEIHDARGVSRGIIG